MTAPATLTRMVNVRTSCECGLSPDVLWPLVLDLGRDSSLLHNLLDESAPFRGRPECTSCGRPLEVHMPCFVVAGALPTVCLMPEPDPNVAGAHARTAADELLRSGRRDLAAAVLQAVPLTKLQTRAVLLVEAERNLPLARASVGPWVWSARVEAVLDEAEQVHRDLPPSACMDEVIGARTYTLRSLVTDSHPYLQSDKADKRLAAVRRRLAREGQPHAAADLGKQPPVAGDTETGASYTLSKHLQAGGSEPLPPEAARALDRLVAARAAAGPPDLADTTWNGLKRALPVCRRHSRSCWCIEAALELLTRADERLPDRDVNEVLGDLAVVLVDVEQGERQHLRDVAARVYRELVARYDSRDDFFLARTLSNLAVVSNAWSSGDVEAQLREGEAAALRAQEYFNRQEHPEEWARCAGSLANNYSARLTGPREENLRAAVRWYLAALEVMSRDANPVGRAQLRSNLGVAYLVGGSSESISRAAPLLEDAREFHRAAGMTDHWCRDTCNLARALILSGGEDNVTRAVRLLQEALAEVSSAVQPTTWAAVASQLAEALVLHSREAEVVAEATELLRDVVDVAVQEGNDRTLRHAAQRLGLMRLNAGQYPGAALALHAAVRASERIRDQQQDQVTRLAERLGDEHIFLHAATAHFAAAAPLEAVVVLEHLRARELLATRETLPDGPPVPSLQAVRKAVDPEHALLYVWALEDRTLAVLLLSGKDDDSFVVGMSATDFLAVPTAGLNWGTPVVGPRPVGPVAAPDDEGDEVLGRGGQVILGRAGAIPDFSALAPAFAELAAPWAKLLGERQVRTLRVVACGPLSNLPWGLLPAADGQPLSHHLIVTYPPSASWLATESPLGRLKASIVIVADTDPSRPLPYAAAEAAEIARFEGAVRLDPNDSDRGGVLALLPQARRLHLACHGDTEPVPGPREPGTWLPVTVADVISRPADDPTLGGFLDSRYRRPAAVAVALAKGQSLRIEDLTPEAVAGTELVVLAGCDTGLLARQRLSDELFGLPAAFLRAGAHAVIAALWPVSDDATALLMVRFHELLNGGLAPTDALHHAQRWLGDQAAFSLLDYVRERSHLDLLGWPRIEDAAPDERPYNDPEHWAAFVHIG